MNTGPENRGPEPGMQSKRLEVVEPGMQSQCLEVVADTPGWGHSKSAAALSRCSPAGDRGLAGRAKAAAAAKCEFQLVVGSRRGQFASVQYAVLQYFQN